MIRTLSSFNSDSDVKCQTAPLAGCAGFASQFRILLQCIMAHAVEADSAQRTQFQRGIKAIADSLGDDISMSDLESAVGKVVRSMEGYSQAASEAFKQQESELQDLLKHMTEMAEFIAAGTATTVKQLGVVESKLTQAVRLQDPRQMRAFMEESLVLVLNESKRVQSEADAKTRALNAEVDRLNGLLKSAKLAASDDPVTGLPARAMAEKTIEDVVDGGKECAIGLFIIDRLVSINGRFGRLVGDQVLVNAGLTLAERLSGATLYRWSGPSFLAVFDPSVSAKTAEEKAQRAAAFRTEKHFQIRDRNALVVITCSLNFHRIAPKAGFATIIDALDASLMQPGMEDK